MFADNMFYCGSVSFVLLSLSCVPWQVSFSTFMYCFYHSTLDTKPIKATSAESS